LKENSDFGGFLVTKSEGGEKKRVKNRQIHRDIKFIVKRGNGVAPGLMLHDVEPRVQHMFAPP